MVVKFKLMFVYFNVNMQHCLAQTPVRRGDGPLALVLAPTRELAQQIEKEVIFFFYLFSIMNVFIKVYVLIL